MKAGGEERVVLKWTAKGFDGCSIELKPFDDFSGVWVLYAQHRLVDYTVKCPRPGRQPRLAPGTRKWTLLDDTEERGVPVRRGSFVSASSAMRAAERRAFKLDAELREPPKQCENGCDAPICPPSKVICKACMDKITATFEALLAKAVTP